MLLQLVPCALVLLERAGAVGISEGFSAASQPAWRRPDGTWVPSAANFTSLATPSAVRACVYFSMRSHGFIDADTAALP